MVVGSGLGGNVAALALAKAGNNVTIIAPESSARDPRTAALLHGSVEYLQTLDLWHLLEPYTHPLKVMRLVDASSRLIRSPQIDFRASEIDLDAFGHNIKNQDALDVFRKCIAENKNIVSCPGTVTGIQQDENLITVTLESSEGEEKTLTGDFLVGADGRNSIVRRSMLPDIREWSYPQAALVVDFTHQIDSRFTSTEFHTESGPFTVVPQTAHRAGLVWMETPQTVERLIALPEDALAERLEQEMGSYLGKVQLEGAPASFPLKAMTAQKFGDRRVFLIGDAAHVFPPIGAQGFNLGLRDIETLVSTLANNHSGADLGQIYSEARKADINSRTLGVDLLNRSLLYSLLPLQFARSLGIHLLNGSLPMRKAMMKLGISSKMFING